MNIIITPSRTVPAVLMTVPDSPTFTFTDSSATKTVTASVDGTTFSFPLWTGTAYDSAGDWTQAAANAAALAYLNMIKQS